MSRDRSRSPVEPVEIVEIVEDYVNRAHEHAAKYDNSAPLDESGVWILHRLAADIYAAGFEAGSDTAEARERGRQQRKVDAERVVKATEEATA